MSRYVLVEVRVMVENKGRASVSIRMKPGGACWSDLDPVGTFRLEGVPFPRGAEEAAETATICLREAFPGLF